MDQLLLSRAQTLFSRVKPKSPMEFVKYLVKMAHIQLEILKKALPKMNFFTFWLMEIISQLRKRKFLYKKLIPASGQTIMIHQNPNRVSLMMILWSQRMLLRYHYSNKKCPLIYCYCNVKLCLMEFITAVNLKMVSFTEK